MPPASDNGELRQQRGQTEPRRARAPRRAVERVISPPPWSPANFDVLRPLPLDTPLPSPVWFRPAGRPISGGIQG